MSLTHTFLRVANLGIWQRGLRWTNSVLRPPRPIGMRVCGHKVYAGSLDRLAALWMRKWTSAERYETKIWMELIEPGMIVADVGANLGVYSLLAARAVGDTGQVHSFEPDRDNFALLQRNIQANGYTNVVTHQAAVADQTGTLTLYVRPAHHGDHRIYEPAGSQRVPVSVPATTIDAAFADAPRVDVIKLDVQGAEARVLAGMTETIKANPSMAVISEFYPKALRQADADPVGFLRALREAGFRIQQIDDDHERLVDLADQELLALCRRIRYTNLLLTRS